MKIASFDTTEYISCIVCEDGKCYWNVDNTRLNSPHCVQWEYRYRDLMIDKCVLSGAPKDRLVFEFGLVLSENGELFKIVRRGPLTLEKIEYATIGIDDENEVIVDVIHVKDNTLIITSNYNRLYHHGKKQMEKDKKKRGTKRKFGLVGRFIDINARIPIKFQRNNDSSRTATQ